MRLNRMIFLLSVISMSFICINDALGQTAISIIRAGFDKVMVQNNLSHSITLQIGSGSTLILAPNGSYYADFTLNTYNVRNTPFTIGYNRRSYLLDSLLCVNEAERRLRILERKKNLLLFLSNLFQGTRTGDFFDLVRGLFCSFFSGGDCDFLMAELNSVLDSKDSEDAKRKRMEAIIEKYWQKVKDVIINESECLEAAKRNLGRQLGTTFYAKNFIDMQEKSRIEITPVIPLGFRSTVFRGVNHGKGISVLGYSAQVPFGVSAAINFNAYDKYRVRKIDRKYYIPLAFHHSPAVYKKSIDSVFKQYTGYSWNFFSLGFGSEFIYHNNQATINVSRVNLDFGIVTNTLSMLRLDSAKRKILSRETVSRFRGYVPYINIGCKFRLLNWLDLSASYYSTFFYNNLKYDKKDMPAFRQVNLGLNIILARHISYQY
jgi:hypothetical protein